MGQCVELIVGATLLVVKEHDLTHVRPMRQGHRVLRRGVTESARSFETRTRDRMLRRMGYGNHDGSKPILIIL